MENEIDNKIVEYLERAKLILDPHHNGEFNKNPTKIPMIIEIAKMIQLQELYKPYVIKHDGSDIQINGKTYGEGVHEVYSIHPYGNVERLKEEKQ